MKYFTAELLAELRLRTLVWRYVKYGYILSNFLVQFCATLCGCMRYTCSVRVGWSLRWREDQEEPLQEVSESPAQRYYDLLKHNPFPPSVNTGLSQV